MSEFELTIRCSKDIRRITLDFGNSGGVGVDFSDEREHDGSSQQPIASKKTEVDPLERYLSVQAPSLEKKSSPPPTPSNLPVPDVQGRPPLVDEGFNESL